MNTSNESAVINNIVFPIQEMHVQEKEKEKKGKKEVQKKEAQKKQPVIFNVPPITNKQHKFPRHIHKIIKDSKTDLINNQTVADLYNDFISELTLYNNIVSSTCLENRHNKYNKYRLMSFKPVNTYTLSFPCYYSSNAYTNNTSRFLKELENLNDKWMKLYDAIYPTLTEYLNKMIVEEDNRKKEIDINKQIRYYTKKISESYTMITSYRKELDLIDPDKYYRNKIQTELITKYNINV
jgi:hypothetical protein